MQLTLSIGTGIAAPYGGLRDAYGSAEADLLTRSYLPTQNHTKL